MTGSSTKNIGPHNEHLRFALDAFIRRHGRSPQSLTEITNVFRLAQAAALIERTDTKKKTPVQRRRFR